MTRGLCFILGCVLGVVHVALRLLGREVDWAEKFAPDMRRLGKCND